jgi:hypothetical protein
LSQAFSTLAVEHGVVLVYPLLLFVLPLFSNLEKFTDGSTSPSLKATTTDRSH